MRLLILYILYLFILSSIPISCIKKPVIVTPVSANGIKIIRGFCTGYAIYTEDYGVIFRVEDIFCRDYDTTAGQFLSETLPGRLIIEEGEQYIHIAPEVLQQYFEELGDEGVLEFSQVQN